VGRCLNHVGTEGITIAESVNTFGMVLGLPIQLGIQRLQFESPLHHSGVFSRLAPKNQSQRRLSFL
jgi:hypothetical protein